jgi:hypothetical protein
MVIFLGICFIILSLWGVPVQAASVSIGWNYTANPQAPHTGFQVARCTVPLGASTCTPMTDLAGGSVGPTVLSYTDTTAQPGNSYCYTAMVLSLGGRSDPALTTAGVPFVCKTIVFQKPQAPTNLREVTTLAMPMKAKAKTRK